MDSELKDRFDRDGFVMVRDAIEPRLLKSLRDQFGRWVEESREHTGAWGSTIDGRNRFDVEKGHCPERPALRRINSPPEISAEFYEAAFDSTVADIASGLVGPAIKYHHSKINSKLPGARTEVKWHQDFPFTPHSNDDVVTALLFLDDVVDENGALEVDPRSHRGEIYSLWNDGVFSAAVADSVAREASKRAIRCTGPAGSCCFMHTRLLHGSAANQTPNPRTLFITVYSADDAVPLSPNPVPSALEGKMVRGRNSGRVRTVPFDLELPQLPQTASFFDQQDSAARG